MISNDTLPATMAARRTVACIAFRHIDDANEAEREAVLIALIDALPEREAKLAQDALFNLREARRLQLELAELLVDFKRGGLAG